MAKTELEIAVLVGADSKVWLAKATELCERMEKAAGILKPGKKAKPVKQEEVDSVLASDDGEDQETDEFAKPSKRGKQKANGFDDEEEELEKEESEDDDEQDEEDEEEEKDEIEVSAVRRGKAKKVTTDDINDACKAKVAALVEDGSTGKEARTKVLSILKKKFEVTSISELDPSDYPAVIKAMAV